MAVVLLGNTILNGLILRLLGYKWRQSLYAGPILVQIGEFSFVLAAVGLSSHIISDIATTTGNAYTLSAPGISATLIPSSPVSS